MYVRTLFRGAQMCKIGKKGCVFGHIDKFWKEHDRQIKKTACKNTYLRSFFKPEKYVIRVPFVRSMDEPDTPSCHSSGPPGTWIRPWVLPHWIWLYLPPLCGKFKTLYLYCAVPSILFPPYFWKTSWAHFCNTLSHSKNRVCWLNRCEYILWCFFLFFSPHFKDLTKKHVILFVLVAYIMMNRRINHFTALWQLRLERNFHSWPKG